MKRERTSRKVGRRWRRKCSYCRVEKDLITGFTHRNRKAKSILERYSYECKACAVKRQAERRRALMADPETAREERARKNAWQRSWRERHPEQYRAQLKRYQESVRANPERYQRALENRRIDYRLGLERNGASLEERKWQTRPQQVKFPKKQSKEIPAQPLGSAVVEASKRSQAGGLKPFCAKHGIHERTIFAWATGERKSVRFHVAEDILVRLGLFWHDVWPPDEYPEVEAEFASAE